MSDLPKPQFLTELQIALTALRFTKNSASSRAPSPAARHSYWTSRHVKDAI
jgi:hypothetical protein